VGATRTRKDGFRTETAARKNRIYVPEKIEKTEHLHHHADGWPLEKDEEDASEETGGPTQLVLTREKVKRLLWTDDEEETAEKEDLKCMSE
jgi:hypothetical protein